MRRIKLGLIALAVTVGIALSAPPIHAQDSFPSRPVKIVVPFSPGSGTDILARILADRLARQWGSAVFVENVAGASGNLGATEVFRAPPDGHTLMLCPPGPISTNGALFKDMGYDPARWTVLSWLASVPYVLVVRKGFVASFKELIARAQAAPGTVTYASPGLGGTAHLSSAQLEMLAGIKLLSVPYRGLGPAMHDIIAGHVDMMFDTIATSLPLHRQDEVRIVAVASAQRAEALPEVPTVAESGYPGYRSITWFGLVAPPATPIALAERINRDVAGIIRSRDVSDKLRELQMEPVGSTRAEAEAFFADEAVLWGKIIKDANITLD